MAAPAPPAAAVDPARTQFSLIAGVAATLQEALFGIDRASPLVASYPYLDWTVPVAGQATVPRSSIVGTALLGAARATIVERARFDTEPFLSNEWEASYVSAIFHEYDKVSGLNTVYANERAWTGAIPGLKAKMVDLSRDDHPLRPRFGDLLGTEDLRRTSLGVLLQVVWGRLSSISCPKFKSDSYCGRTMVWLSRTIW